MTPMCLLYVCEDCGYIVAQPPDTDEPPLFCDSCGAVDSSIGPVNESIN